MEAYFSNFDILKAANENATYLYFRTGGTSIKTNSMHRTSIPKPTQVHHIIKPFLNYI